MAGPHLRCGLIQTLSCGDGRSVGIVVTKWDMLRKKNSFAKTKKAMRASLVCRTADPPSPQLTCAGGNRQTAMASELPTVLLLAFSLSALL